jgi:hypothetical protein
MTLSAADVDRDVEVFRREEDLAGGKPIQQEFHLRHQMPKRRPA